MVVLSVNNEQLQRTIGTCIPYMNTVHTALKQSIIRGPYYSPVKGGKEVKIKVFVI